MSTPRGDMEKKVEVERKVDTDNGTTKVEKKTEIKHENDRHDGHDHD